jgi:hypothetical protein
MAGYKDGDVGDYVFFSEKDAQLARAEEKKIEYLEARIDYSKPEKILHVYEQSIHERIFKTPIGLEYLRKMRTFLLSQKEIDAQRVPHIPVYTPFSGELRDQTEPVKERILAAKEKEVEDKKSRFTVSVVLNILLVIAVCAMFAISLNSENPNIVNYEKNINNKYASWEEEKELDFTD